MFVDLLVYLVVFAAGAVLISAFQRVYCRTMIRGLSEENAFRNSAVYCIIELLFLFPLLAMYGLRYGIGTDYFGYEQIYSAVHGATLPEYWKLHSADAAFFYVEPGYYLLNRISPGYRSLIWSIGILLFVLFFIAIKDYASRISFSLSLFIFLSTQFIYSMNAVRFALALCFLLVGYIALAKNKTALFVGMVLLSSLFHVSTILCLLLVFLKQFKNPKLNKFRDTALFIMIVVFPFISGYLLKILSSFPLFERYFATSIYSAGSAVREGLKWLLHIVPVMLPLLLFCREEIFDAEETRTLFRVCLMEIPFRSIGLYNTSYTRYARCAQIVQVVFLPLVLSKVSNKRMRTALIAYYVAWFVFYFCYYAVVGDGGDSLPYVWIFS